MRGDLDAAPLRPGRKSSDGDKTANGAGVVITLALPNSDRR
jgi:hypothetical protein